jgi:copper homeostasis protein (lipoprotein)
LPLQAKELPATFVGTLPCADCEGIRYQLNLFADDSFFLRMTYVGKKAEPVDDLGSWAVSSDRRVLVLKGRADRPEEMFAIPSPGVLRKLDVDGQPIPGRAPAELTRSSEFRPIDVKVAVRGMYVKAGNVGAFVDCSTGQLWQVSAEGKAVAELDGAYAAAKPAPGTAMLADLEGVVALHPRTAETGLRDTLNVQRFVRVQRGGSCPARFGSTPLAGTFWKLTNLGGKAIAAVADSRRQPSITFTAPMARTPGQYSGSTGCNRVVGTYSAENATISLVGGGTLRACKEDAANEAALLAALKNARTYRIAGHVLELFDDKGMRLARFES